MRKKWIVLSVSAAILIPAVILVISLVILSNIDFNKHRDTIAEHISKASGRQLSLNGVLELNLASTTSIVITDIALANAPWASDPDMLTIQRFEIKFELYPLLYGNIYIPHLYLEGVKAVVETDDNGLSNWMLTEQLHDQVKADEPGSQGEIKLPWIGNMQVSDAVVSYHDRQTGKKISSKLNHARISTVDKTSPTVIDIVGRINKHPVEINGQLTLDSSSSIPEIHADLTLAKLNFDKLLYAKGKQTKTETKKSGKPKTDRVFSDEPLPFEKLSLANINIRLQLKDIVRNKNRLKEVLIKANLTEGKFTATILKHSLFQGEFVADLVVDASNKETADITIQLNVPQIELSEIVVADSGAAAVKGPLAIDIKLHSRGNSVAQIMGSLNGNIKLLMEQGSTDAKALDMFVGGLSAMVGTIFTDKSSKTTINCAISDLIIVDGILTPQLAVLDTQFSTLFADGQADLKNEKLNIKVTPVAKGVTLSVAFPVHLQGTFGKPQIQIKKTDALVKSGEIWATVVYPAALLLKFTDLDDGKQNPCVSMVAKKTGIPNNKDIGKAVGGTVKGVGTGVSNLQDSTKKGPGPIAPTETAIEAVAEDEEDDFEMD